MQYSSRIIQRLLPCILGISTALAQRNLTEIPSTDLQSQLSSFKMAEGMEIQLFASEPMVEKPIQMAWDARGRLWVASSAIYPHIKPGQTQSDKIIILEDTNQDGKADKSTTFYEGLFIPTGIWPQDGGVYVANSTELLFMRDTNGDDKCDEREVLLSGFGTEDTHHILHSIKGGHDGKLYFNQSVYIHSHVETPFGVRRLLGSGIWQYHPTTKRLEVFSMGQINPWGHIFDPWGQSFTTDGAYGEGINYTFPGATFRCLPDQLPRILKGLNPGQPKQCGLEMISGRHFPDEWQGNLITCDFRGHRVNRFAVSDEGSGYRSQQMPDLVSSTHGSFRPVDLNMGPDGALYIADWYNPIIQHGEVDFRDPRRDHSNGRIWRVSAKSRAPSPRVDLAKLPVNELFAQLKAPEQWVRYWTKQEIKSRKLPDLTKHLELFLKDATPQQSLEAMWTAQTCGVENFGWVFANFWVDTGRPDDAKRRAATVRMLHQMIMEQGLSCITDSEGKPMPDNVVREMFEKLIVDEHPRVRLETVNLLRTVGTPEAIEIATAALSKPMDSNLDFALWRTCYERAAIWLPAFQSGKITFQGNAERTLFALKSANQADAAKLLLDMVGQNKVTGANADKLIEIVGSTGKQEDVNGLLSFLLDKNRSESLRKASASALVTAHQQRQLTPAGAEQAMVSLLNNGYDTSMPVALKLAGLWKIESLRASLEKWSLAKQDDASHEALQSIALLGSEKSSAFLIEHVKKSTTHRRQASALQALAKMDVGQATPHVATFLASISNGDTAADALFQDYLNRPDAMEQLAKALDGKKLSADFARKALQKTSATAGNTKPLMDALTKAGNLTPVLSLDPQQMQAMIAEVQQSGDAARGEKIYRQAAMQCNVCHAIGPVGGIVGPNLVSIGSSAPMDYIIDSLLEPAKKIKEGYATAMIQMKDGTTQTGFLSRQDDKEIILRDAAGKDISLALSQVAKKEVIPISLMPAGLTANLRRDELVDLVKFLSELGKDGPYKVQDDGTVRAWHYRTSGTDQNTIPLSTLTNGEIPLQEIPVIELAGKRKRVVESTFVVTEAGDFSCTVSAADGLRFEIDGQECFPENGKIRKPVSIGKHMIRLLLPESTTANVKVQLKDSTAKIQLSNDPS